MPFSSYWDYIRVCKDLGLMYSYFKVDIPALSTPRLDIHIQSAGIIFNFHLMYVRCLSIFTVILLVVFFLSYCIYYYCYYHYCILIVFFCISKETQGTVYIELPLVPDSDGMR